MIFIVDDDAAIRESLRFLLSCEGLDARSFESASRFLESCTLTEQDCVITDIHLPGMDGLALLRAIRAKGLKNPVIIMTGWPNSLARQRAAEMGATVFLEKPLKDAEILAAVRNCLPPSTPG
ncbi:MAG: response regulator [Proteobacteria bacterium]|nr:response regulator [Pseudomonadota bacterium]